VNRNQQNYSTMDLPVELVGLLKHAGIDGEKLTWNLQVNSSAISVKLMWIKAENPVEKTGQVTSQVQKKKRLSPSTRKRNAQRINQWKAKRNEGVGDSKICAPTQTNDSNSITDEITQTEQLHSDEQALHKPTPLTQIRERSTQTRSNFIGRQLTPTNTSIRKKPGHHGINLQLYKVRTSEVNYHITLNSKTDRCPSQSHSTRTTQH
jgi:hypothetical protein